MTQASQKDFSEAATKGRRFAAAHYQIGTTVSIQVAARRAPERKEGGGTAVWQQGTARLRDQDRRVESTVRPSSHEPERA
jgi:hypothetical protein